DSHTVAHKERPKGDAGRQLKASVWRRNPLKKRPKGDAGYARSFLKRGRHASCGKYPGRQDSHTVAHKERPKGDAGMCRTHPESLKKDPGARQLPKGIILRDVSPLMGTLVLANFLREIILRDVQNTPGVPQEGPWYSPTS
ncbi:hypothetical protein Prudu_021767, partial [Prunus dulcis]